MNSRWVLTWKPIPPGERAEALEKRSKEMKDGKTTISSKGDKKAKARLVIIGFQHPDLGTSKLKTASPVLAQSTRQLMLAHASWRRLDLYVLLEVYSPLGPEEARFLLPVVQHSLRR